MHTKRTESGGLAAEDALACERIGLVQLETVLPEVDVELHARAAEHCAQRGPQALLPVHQVLLDVRIVVAEPDAVHALRAELRQPLVHELPDRVVVLVRLVAQTEHREAQTTQIGTICVRILQCSDELLLKRNTYMQYVV